MDDEQPYVLTNRMQYVSLKTIPNFTKAKNKLTLQL